MFLSAGIFARWGASLDFSATGAKLFVLPISEQMAGNSRTTGNDPTSSLLELPDEFLFQRVQEGDKDALSHLFHRHARAVRNVGRRILRDAGEAEDLVQEVFLYVFRKCSLYNSAKGAARSWLIQVAYTQAFLRRRKLRSHGFYQPAKAERPTENQACENLGSPYDYTVEGLFGRRGWRAVLDDLSEDQREVLRLHFFEGYTFAEIAEKLGTSYANVRSRHYRGLEKLRKHLSATESNGQ